MVPRRWIALVTVFLMAGAQAIAQPKPEILKFEPFV